MLRARLLRSCSFLPVITVLSVAGCGHSSSTEQPKEAPRVTVAHPVVRDLVDEDDFAGWLQAAETVEVRARVRGHIAKVHFLDGDLVEKDQLLFELDRRPFQGAIEDKQVAQQQVQTESQILAQKKIQADQAVAQAQGQADSNVKLAEGQAAATIALAQGQATANTTLAASLSDQILQYQYIQKLTDKITVMLLPSGNASIFDLKGLLNQNTPSPSSAP